MRTKISIALLASAALAGSANASITWYLQLNGTNLSSEVFQVVTTGDLVNGQAGAGSYTIQSIVSSSGQSAYVNFANISAPELGYASLNGVGFDWNGTAATGFWSWYQSGPFTQTRQEGFRIQAFNPNDNFTVNYPWGAKTVSNGWNWNFGSSSQLVDSRSSFASDGVTGGTNITGGISIVSLTNPVPAPGAIALVGLAGLAGRRRR
ncbi:MAG: hypothetical protein RIR10_735 [Planctomycetota bacterium]